MVERCDANFSGRRRERIEGLQRRRQVAQRIVQRRHDEGRPVLRVAIEILAGELSDAYGDAIVQPSLLDPPRIEAGRVGTHQAARPGHESEIQSEIASSLSQAGCVEIPSVEPCQRAEIDVDGGAESVPHGKGPLLALEAPEGVADILEVESHALLLQACSRAAPISEQIGLGRHAGLGVSMASEDTQTGQH
jgi:hypothetical protein